MPKNKERALADLLEVGLGDAVNMLPPALGHAEGLAALKLGGNINCVAS